MTEIHIHGPVTIVQHNETTAKTPSAPPRPVPKPPTDNGGRLISRGGMDLPTTPSAKRDSGPKTRWRVWSEERPEQAERILVRFRFNGSTRYHVAYLDGTDLMDESSDWLFLKDSLDPSEAIYLGHMPDDLKWIPLDELLKGVA